MRSVAQRAFTVIFGQSSWLPMKPVSLFVRTGLRSLRGILRSPRVSVVSRLPHSSRVSRTGRRTRMLPRVRSLSTSSSMVTRFTSSTADSLRVWRLRSWSRLSQFSNNQVSRSHHVAGRLDKLVIVGMGCQQSLAYQVPSLSQLDWSEHDQARVHR